MIEVSFPEPNFRVKKQDGVEYIFDPIRKIWLVLTDEEWVRQNFIQYLVQNLNYPSDLVAVEKKIMLGELIKRFDILIFDKNHKPWMIVECKAGNIPLKDSVLQQALRYNISVPVPFIVITNGRETYAWEKTTEGIGVMKEMPKLT